MLPQHRISALFGLFVRSVGSVRFMRAVAPVAALVAAVSIPLPQAASQVGVAASVHSSAHSSGLVQALAIAQRATSRVDAPVVPIGDRPASRSHSPHRSSASSNDVEGASPVARIGDRWLRLRAGHRAMQPDQTPSPGHIGERLLDLAMAEPADAWKPSGLTALSFLGASIKPVASIGARSRAPPPSAMETQGVGDPQPAAVGEVARTPRFFERSRSAATPPQIAAGTEPKPRRAPPETLLPLKLTDEQRTISRFIARRYRVKLDDVQRFVAHAFRAAGEFGLDPYLVLAVMSIESSFDPDARSRAGAQGLMQVLTRVHLEKFAPFGGAHAAFDPMANITVGSRILKEYLVREGSVEGALKSYVGAALLSHDFGYGRKVLAERQRIVTAVRQAGAPMLLVEGGHNPTRLAMASKIPARLRGVDPRGASGADATNSGRNAATKTTRASDTRASEAASAASMIDAAESAVESQIPAQASEPRASSEELVTPSAAMREL